MHKILVTGASGFIGANVVRGALEQGWSVVAAVRDSMRAPRLDPLLKDYTGRLCIMSGFDLLKRGSAAEVIGAARPNAIVHAASLGAQIGVAGLTDLLEGDVAGLGEILEEARSHEPAVRTVVLGSAFAYGKSDSAHDEDECLEPNLPYGLAKALCANIAAFERRRGGQVTELRLFNVYGQGDVPPRLVPSCIAAALTGEAVRIASGEEVRDFVHVDDVVKVTLAAASGALPAGIYNVVTGTATRVADLARIVVELSGSRSSLETGAVAARHDDHRVLVGSPKRLDAFGLRPVVVLREGLKRTIALETDRSRAKR